MPAKPQQMADNQEKSDDLIAELAKLMASNAQGAESEGKPSVIKLTPLSEATPAGTEATSAAKPAPLRIPGMEGPKPATPATEAASSPPAASQQPTNVRIPGMDAPKPAGPPPAPAPSAQERPAAAGQPTTPPVSQPAAPPASPSPAPPTAASSLPPRPTSGQHGTAPATASAAQAAAAFAQPRSTSSTPFAAGLRAAGEPKTEAAPAPAAAPRPVPETPAKADTVPAAKGDDDDSFDFDFGFDTPSAPQGGTAAAAAPGHPADDDEDKAAADQHPGEDREQAASAEDDDPIADLIKAELGAPQAAETPDTPGAEYPASVEAVPARSFGRNSVQAPVLIGHPARAAQPAPVHPEQRRQEPKQQEPRQEPRADGGDRFTVAPVFGLGSAQQRQEPAADQDSDPMAEIENLIGEAVRVQMSDPERPQQQEREAQRPPPVVPPLTTGFAPRRAGLKDVESRTRSAEAAILAAAAATGAEVGRVEPAMGAEEAPYRRSKVKPPNTRSFGGMRQYLGMGVALVLLVAAGLGLYWVLGMGSGDPDTAPVLTADTSPVKEAPAAPAAETAEAPRSVVFDEIDGLTGDDQAETLVSRDETADTPITEVARVEEPEVTETGLANRRVRTVTVRPDGTIVSADEAVAGSEALPVERPNVPELPGLSDQPSELLASTSDGPLVAPTPTDGAATGATGTEGAAEDPIAALVAGTATATGATEPVPEVDAGGEMTELASLDREPDAPVVFDGSLAAPTPMPRPTDRSSLTGAGQAATSAPASATTANAPASLPLVSLTGGEPAATPAPPVNANAYVQLASLPSESEARSQVNAMQSRWGNLFGGQSLVVQRAELGGGRVTYRLRLPTGSLQEATQICASIKANGGDCFATNG